MPLTSSALQIGKNALIAYQQALQSVGNNIANAANPAYSRISPELASRSAANVGGIYIGTGVEVAAIRRNVVESLESRLRTAVSDREAALTNRTALDRVEALYNALGDDNLATALSGLFAAFSDLQNSPDDPAARGVVVQRGVALADALQKARRDLIDLRETLNDDVGSLARRAADLARQIADLNVQITAADAGGASRSGGLRDQRGALLGELAELMDITTREQPDGAINVYVGSEPLVQFGVSRGLTVEEQAIGGGLTNAIVRFEDNNGSVSIRGGQIGGAIAARDNAADVQLERVNKLATALIQEINKVHASGQGLNGFTTLTGQYGVLDPDAALNSAAAGLGLAPQSGTFFVEIRDNASGAVVRHQFTVDLDGLNGNDTTLNSLAAQINALIPGLATVQADGRLALNSPSGATFRFADDRSNLLAALGLNAFFDGTDASDIAVSTLVAGDPAMLAAAMNGLPGDGSNAGRLAAAADTPADLLGGASLAQYHQASVTESAVAANAAGNTLAAADVILGGLTAQRESVSGVNLDEEAVRMLAFQRAYQGAARYLSVVDEMLQALLGLVR